jgi:thiol-disulfide isomerase/thioredoxin
MGKARTAHRVRQEHLRFETVRAAQVAQRRHRIALYWIPAVVVLAVAIVAVFVTVGGKQGTSAAKPTIAGPSLSAPLSAGSTIPNFEAPALNGGGAVSWRSYRGEPTVLEVWAPWCPHCQAEAPVLVRLAHEFPAVKVVTVATAVGLNPGPTPQEFVRQFGYTFPVGLDDRNGTIASGLGVRGFPLIYYVGSDGKVVSVQEGEAPEQQMRASFAALSGVSTP